MQIQETVLVHLQVRNAAINRSRVTSRCEADSCTVYLAWVSCSLAASIWKYIGTYGSTERVFEVCKVHFFAETGSSEILAYLAIVARCGVIIVAVYHALTGSQNSKKNHAPEQVRCSL